MSKEIVLHEQEKQRVEKALFSALQAEILPAMREKVGMDVLDEESARQALSCSLQARKLKNAIEKSRKEIVRPHMDFQKAVAKMAKDVYEDFERIEQDFAAKVIAWMDSQKDNPFTRCDEIQVDDGSLTLKSGYDFVIDDLSQVPLEYLTIDSAKIKEDIEKGVRAIPGLKIRPVEVVTMRVKN
jgi:hypothetical protein